MAKKKKDKKDQKVKKKKGNGQIFFLTGCIMAIVFFPTTLLLMFGMLPTPAAALVSRDKKRSRVLTVGAMNLAGCMPFLLELWAQGHTLVASIDVLTSPLSIIVMYSAAGVGYLIDWALTGVVATMLYERGKKRKIDIVERQKDLVERWGKKVTGEIALDANGFPVEPVHSEEKKE